MSKRMTKTQIREALQEKRVFNSYAFFDKQPYLVREARWGRDVLPSRWAVQKRGVDLTGGKGGWHERGAKWFTYSSREGSERAKEEAKAWMEEMFGIEEWGIDPFGAYGDKKFIEQRIEELISPSA